MPLPAEVGAASVTSGHHAKGDVLTVAAPIAPLVWCAVVVVVLFGEAAGNLIGVIDQSPRLPIVLVGLAACFCRIQAVNAHPQPAIPMVVHDSQSSLPGVCLADTSTIGRCSGGVKSDECGACHTVQVWTTATMWCTLARPHAYVRLCIGPAKHAGAAS